MAFIGTSSDDEDFFESNRDEAGYVPNYVGTFAARPAVFAAWKQLSAAVRSSMDLRRYELATFAAATALRSSYCSLAHGKILSEQFMPADEVAELVTGQPTDPVDRAVMSFARKVALSADRITQADVDHLRVLGLSDEDVLDVVLAAAVRCFFSKTLDATGTPPDSAYHALLPAGLREVLTVGRDIDPPQTG
ncbi:putative peroxidase-related enzyme [Kribbella sp. VKM Ac-2527]|uniref:Putative peroxidase-related enzyme n=1 Tax=Kribbella caucasensis TaxID=2512215 RepID=A0A4R6KS27_9ACTN|nr:carboxymuconolactone decarboxylase family protein [Kribbella sp. VKM Ac-2527]TDO54238.1 putative peroxidase-related enzyme [Kribbella sp. VKM Ac-2527]